WSAAPLDLALASASVSGLRSAGMSAALLSINPFARTAVYELVALDSSISPGAGPILSLTFNIGDAAEGTVGQVNVAANSGFSPEFVSPYGVYAPAALSGNVAVFCCDTPGDANNSGSVNIADVTFLVARIFAGGPAPDCLKEGNANGGGSINIADVTFLIARIFAGGPAPICGP
ncbi:MAG: dockerin type I repeat-containing protein, partial [Candidatus Zixiibacteriota bacterium]